MDFLVASKDQASDNKKRNIEMRLFKNSVFSPTTNPKEQVDQDTDFTGQLKEESAKLDLVKIKPADRVTFLMNYIYLVLTNNQFSWASCADQISLLREVFFAVVDPYIQILSLWVS